MTAENEEINKDESTPKQRQHRALIGLVVLIVCFVAALTIGLVLNDDDDDGVTLMKREGLIVDCLPGLRREEAKMRMSKEECIKRGCLFKPQIEKGAPWCHVVHDKMYSMTASETDAYQGGHTKMSANLTTKKSSSQGVSDVFEKVSVHVEYQTDNRVRIKLYPSDMPDRWEIPKDMLDIESTNEKNANNMTSKISVSFVENPFGVVVKRKDTGTIVFDSSNPGTLLADQFLRLTTSLPSGHLYGFGEHNHRRLHHDMAWKSWAMFTRDFFPSSEWNLYGQHPVYLNVENDGKANMVLLKNSNAMEVTLQPEPYPAVTFTTIGGVLDFYVYVGESPVNVTSHYVKSIGLPVFPPYWSLGYHLCRWGFHNKTDMQNVIAGTIAADIPYDSQWADIDTYYKKYPFTYDPVHWADFPDFVKKELTDTGRHFVTIVDPGVGANESIINEIKAFNALNTAFGSYNMFESGKTTFIRNASGTGELLGKVWPGITAFPDFTNPITQNWWTNQIKHYIQRFKIKADALWIDMNEPASFVPGSVNGCQKNKWNNPEWCPNILDAGDDCQMYTKTLCMDSVQHGNKRHYDVHSLYGHSMAMQTHKSLGEVIIDKRPWTMTRSSFVGTGKYATKWMGDNSATWEDMHYSIISIIEFGFFGFAMNGADICGFFNEPSNELCVRWHQLGAFYPFARNHNSEGNKHQDPVSLGQDVVDLVKPVLYTRYKLLPYLYTSMYQAHTQGHMVMQPLFYQFPEDTRTLKIDTQFMLGPAMLISPVLKEGATSVSAYFPKGRWFDYLTGEEIISQGSTFDLVTPLDKFNLHLRGGHVIPWQEPAVTTTESRKKPLGLMVVLNEVGKAEGKLFWDDGQSNTYKNNKYYMIKFDMEKAGKLRIEPTTMYSSSLSWGKLKFETIEIYGLPRLPASVNASSGSGSKSLEQNQYKYINEGVVRITGLNFLMQRKNWISWSFY